MAGVNGVQESNNTGLYAGAVGAGAVAGGGGAYWLTKAIKDGEPTDKFVSHAFEAITGDAKTAFEAKAAIKPELKTYLEGFKDVSKTTIGEGKEALEAFRQTVTSTLKTHGLEGEAVTKGLAEVTNAETMKTFAENMLNAETAKAQKAAIKSYIKEGAFVTEGESKTVGEALSKLASNFKWKAAAKWSAIGAAALGIATYIYKKCSGAPAEQPKDVA